MRAEFLRARNFEYVRAARALGVPNGAIMFRHLLPNAMVATLTMLPFLVTGAIGTLAGLDFLGYGLPSSSPSLGELTLQAKQNLQAPWLGFTAFFTFAIMLALLVFIFEGVRDAFDPRKTFDESRPSRGRPVIAAEAAERCGCPNVLSVRDLQVLLPRRTGGWSTPCGASASTWTGARRWRWWANPGRASR